MADELKESGSNRSDITVSLSNDGGGDFKLPRLGPDCGA